MGNTPEAVAGLAGSGSTPFWSLLAKGGGGEVAACFLAWALQARGTTRARARLACPRVDEGGNAHSGGRGQVPFLHVED